MTNGGTGPCCGDHDAPERRTADTVSQDAVQDTVLTGPRYVRRTRQPCTSGVSRTANPATVTWLGENPGRGGAPLAAAVAPHPPAAKLSATASTAIQIRRPTVRADDGSGRAASAGPRGRFPGWEAASEPT